MSLYRQAQGPSLRALAIAAAVALIVGGLVGYLIGRETAPEPTLVELVTEAREELRPALSALELVGIEYSEALRGDEVIAETEYDAARSQAQLAADTLASASELRALDPRAVEAAEARVREVAELVERRVEERRLRGPLGEARVALAALTGQGIEEDATGG